MRDPDINRRYRARQRGEDVPLRKVGGKTIPIEKRFWNKVEKTSSCWFWKAGCFKAGYGAVRYNGKAQYAHIVAYLLSGNVIPEGKELHHTCENPPCVNPKHLKPMIHGEHSSQHTRGELNKLAKLTDERVHVIRSSPETGRTLAKRFCVSETTISYVRLWKTWRHVSPPFCV